MIAVSFKNPTEWAGRRRLVSKYRELNTQHNTHKQNGHYSVRMRIQLNETRICNELGVFKCNNPYLDLRALQTALVQFIESTVKRERVENFSTYQ